MRRSAARRRRPRHAGSCRSAPVPSCWPPPDCSTAAAATTTGRRPASSARRTRTSTSIPTCSSSTTATSSPRPGSPPASTCACTSIRRDHGAAVANAAARRVVVAPVRPAGRRSSSTPRCPPRPAPHSQPPARGRWAASTGRSPSPTWPGTPRQRTHAHPAVPRRDRPQPAAVAAAPAHRTRQGAAGVHRPARRPGRQGQRPRHRRLPAHAPAPACRAHPDRLPVELHPADLVTRTHDRRTGIGSGHRAAHGHAGGLRRERARADARVLAPGPRGGERTPTRWT